MVNEDPSSGWSLVLQSYSVRLGVSRCLGTQHFTPQLKTLTAQGSHWNIRVLVTSWWLNQPIWKIMSKIGSSPRIRMNMQIIWNHHLDPQYTTNNPMVLVTHLSQLPHLLPIEVRIVGWLPILRFARVPKWFFFIKGSWVVLGYPVGSLDQWLVNGWVFWSIAHIAQWSGNSWMYPYQRTRMRNP